MKATLGHLRVSCRVLADSAPFVRAALLDADTPPPAQDPEPEGPPPRLRRVSMTGTGRGTGRGGKPAAKKLTRLLKKTGPRSDFVRLIGGRDVSVESVKKQFDMTNANVNGYLTNIHRDHGIGYEKEGGTLRLILPEGHTFKTVWAD